MKYPQHEDFDTLMNALRHNPARFISFRHGPILDKDAWLARHPEQNPNK